MKARWLQRQLAYLGEDHQILQRLNPLTATTQVATAVIDEVLQLTAIGGHLCFRRRRMGGVVPLCRASAPTYLASSTRAMSTVMPKVWLTRWQPQSGCAVLSWRKRWYSEPVR